MQSVCEVNRSGERSLVCNDLTVETFMLRANTTVALAFAAAALGLAAPSAHAYTVYVTNEKDNTITVIDSEKLE